MKNEQKGFTLFLLMMGAMAGLVAIDIGKMDSFTEIYHPSFLSSILAHFSIVIGAYIGGKKFNE